MLRDVRLFPWDASLHHSPGECPGGHTVQAWPQWGCLLLRSTRGLGEENAAWVLAVVCRQWRCPAWASHGDELSSPLGSFSCPGADIICTPYSTVRARGRGKWKGSCPQEICAQLLKLRYLWCIELPLVSKFWKEFYSFRFLVLRNVFAKRQNVSDTRHGVGRLSYLLLSVWRAADRYQLSSALLGVKGRAGSTISSSIFDFLKQQIP